MENWFKDHPASSIIGHTILVAMATWAVSTFVIDENRVNFIKAQVENERAVNRQLEAKISVLEHQQLALAEENKQLKNWLADDETSYPALTQRITSLEEQIRALEDSTGESLPGQTPSEQPTLYNYSEGFVRGQSFTDPFTGATIGVSEINSDFTARAHVDVPGSEPLTASGVVPGTSWVFEFKGRKFRLTLNEVSWIGNKLRASVVEVE